VHPSASVRVLSVSDYESIRVSRELLLQNFGYLVISMTSDCVLRCETLPDVAIAVIGQTIDNQSASRIAAKLRKLQPNVKLLRLTTQYSRSGAEFNDSCFVEDGPEAFVARVAELADERMDDVEGEKFLAEFSLALCP
jgi:hypothetical protein